MGCSSARTQRLAWFLVLVQGIVLIRLPLCIPWYDAQPSPPVAHDVQRGLPQDAMNPPPDTGPMAAGFSPAAAEFPARRGRGDDAP